MPGRRMTFVFGSNEAGIHGLGAAKDAFKIYGAKWGQGYGPQGNAFGIPTKDAKMKPLPIEKIDGYVAQFLLYANRLCFGDGSSWEDFQITRIGTGYAGFTDEEMANLFIMAPSNCYFDEKWSIYLPDKQFWGTF